MSSFTDPLQTGSYTPTPTNTNTPTLTTTPLPTGSSTPTRTITPTSPPTNTPTPLCMITGGGFAFAVPNTSSFSWTLTSLSTDIVRMIDATISWPSSSPPAKLSVISIGGNSIWTGSQQPSSLHVPEAGWLGATSIRELSPGGSHSIVFNFSKNIPEGAGMSYTVSLIYKIPTTGKTCSVSDTEVFP